MSSSAYEHNMAGLRRGDRQLDLGQALVEARRCLRCYDAPCHAACPAHVDVPGFISRLAEGDYAGSYAELVAANPLPAVCGLACPTMDLCEGACVLNRLGQRPIQVGALQYFVASNYQEPAHAGKAGSGRRVAVVGAGPSGLSCAIELRRLGHAVTVFERTSAAGGLLEQVIPYWRLPQSAVDRELARASDAGVEFRFGEDINACRAAALRQDYDAIYVASGLCEDAPLDLPGRALPGVMPALDFLRAARRAMRGDGPAPVSGDCVVVVGGGNVALDSATAALRLGAERAIVLYRRTLAEMPAWRSEYLEAASLGVEFRWLSAVRAVWAVEGRAGAVEVQTLRLLPPGANGRRQVEVDQTMKPYELPCQAVILAIGQRLQHDVAEALGLEVTAGGRIQAALGSGQTTCPGVFAGGDAINGGATVVEAVANGMSAAHAIHDWLAGKGGC